MSSVTKNTYEQGKLYIHYEWDKYFPNYVVATESTTRDSTSAMRPRSKPNARSGAKSRKRRKAGIDMNSVTCRDTTTGKVFTKEFSSVYLQREFMRRCHYGRKLVVLDCTWNSQSEYEMLARYM